MLDDTAIKVEHLRKTFKLPLENAGSIKNMLVGFAKRRHGYELQEVLKDISFEIKKGEFFGIVGRNGSGKSTLLKMLAGIYTPTSGSITVNGKLTPFIELGVGFNHELTGRENVYLNGALLGFSRAKMNSLYDDIVKFAELEKFMDQKLKNYSSGMQVRLAFSIAIQVQTDILILDEVLAVGDEAFQRKCSDFFEKIKKDKTKTVVLVTHSMGDIKKYCTSAILIKNGKIVASGSPNDVANQYSEINIEAQNLNIKKYPSTIQTVALSKTVITNQEPFHFKITYDRPKMNEQTYLAYSLLDIKRGGIVYDSGIFPTEQTNTSDYAIPLQLLNSGDFRIVASLRVKGKSKEKTIIASTDENSSCVFSIRNDNDSEGDDYALLKTLNAKINVGT